MLFNNEQKLSFITSLIIFFCLTIAYAKPYYGANFSYPLVTKEPPSLHGYQFMLTYDPETIHWEKWLYVYFDGGFSHFWITNKPYYTTLNIYSIAPVVRMMLQQKEKVSLFIDFSIGAAYLNHIYLDNRKLGIHFAFQDRIGVGLLFGTSQQFILGLHAIHYSNAHLSKHNSGITIPVMLDVGYRFQ
ncbi:MAG: hypothetical protein A3F42_03760 [Gammaproteobacteria bacterium RIFCSPHIGHO2_12_FULL_37_34]|nr:MAG: hypothetical protein A3F42_03760 [Gammaproteobacteria bacterium RIFCSPHIGHO2_12_FULL_37_34]